MVSENGLRIGWPRRPRLLADVFDVDEMRALVRANAPYAPIQRYFASAEEQGASGGESSTFVAPWFRGDWVLRGDELVAGARAVLDHEPFIDAAKQVFGAEVVRPTDVYLNLNPPLPFAGPPHIDVPAFRGITRVDYPVSLLHRMAASGLFEAERIEIATGVWWFYDGPGGGFDYWRDGVDEPPATVSSPFHNVAVVGDNDRMFHRVGIIGDPDRPIVKGLTLDAELRWDGEAWSIVDGGRTIESYDPGEVRVSVSWKAEVFTSEAERQRVDAHKDDLTLAAVVDRLSGDLRTRGIEVTEAADPLRDPKWIATLNDAYPWPEAAEG